MCNCPNTFSLYCVFFPGVGRLCVALLAQWGWEITLGQYWEKLRKTERCEENNCKKKKCFAGKNMLKNIFKRPWDRECVCVEWGWKTVRKVVVDCRTWTKHQQIYSLPSTHTTWYNCTDKYSAAVVQTCQTCAQSHIQILMGHIGWICNNLNHFTIFVNFVKFPILQFSFNNYLVAKIQIFLLSESKAGMMGHCRRSFFRFYRFSCKISNQFIWSTWF